MFKKVLIAEDLNSINQGVISVLKALGVAQIDNVSYCDQAYVKIKRAVLDKVPYELLITDLSFARDHRSTTIANGDDLAQKLQDEHPELNKIVFTVEDRVQKARNLIHKYGVKAYVCKGRNGLKELRTAIQAVYANDKYFSDPIASALHGNNSVEILDYDISLLKQLSNGLSQDQISRYFKSNNIVPSSLSTVEKRLNKLKVQFKASNATHLVAIVKDIGLI